MDILQSLEEKGIYRVRIAVCDIDGVLRGKVVHIDKLRKILQDDAGFGFCNVIFGWDMADRTYETDDTEYLGYTGWHTGYPDDRAVLDGKTFREIPWLDGLPFLLGDLPDSYVCPRTLLKKIAAESDRLGYTAKFAQEFEFFHFEETGRTLREKGFRNLTGLTEGMFGYSLLKPVENQEYFDALFEDLADFGVPLEGLHTETGPGVYEACIQYSDVLEAADRAVLLKTAVKEIAVQHGLTATFMAKWNAALPGCGGHLHQSLWEGEHNIFSSNEENSDDLPAVFQNYLAGVLHCLPIITAMYAPTVNSYKRLCGGEWAPNRAGWGIENRTAAIRVINMTREGTRLENRVPGADMNPYLAMSASLASGLYGIRNKLDLTDAPITGNAYQTGGSPLPMNLGEAITRWRSSDLPAELFGKDFAEHFIRTREWEWQQYGKSVSNWELERYLEII